MILCLPKSKPLLISLDVVFTEGGSIEDEGMIENKRKYGDIHVNLYIFLTTIQSYSLIKIPVPFNPKLH